MRSSTAVQAQWTTVVDTIDKCSGRMFVSGLGEHYTDVSVFVHTVCLMQVSQVMLLIDWQHR